MEGYNSFLFRITHTADSNVSSLTDAVQNMFDVSSGSSDNDSTNCSFVICGSPDLYKSFGRESKGIVIPSNQQGNPAQQSNFHG